MKVKLLVTQLSQTLCNPMDCVACQVPPSTGFSRQEYWSGLPFPSSGDLNGETRIKIKSSSSDSHFSPSDASQIWQANMDIRADELGVEQPRQDLDSWWSYKPDPGIRCIRDSQVQVSIICQKRPCNPYLACVMTLKNRTVSFILPIKKKNCLGGHKSHQSHKARGRLCWDSNSLHSIGLPLPPCHLGGEVQLPWLAEYESYYFSGRQIPGTHFSRLTALVISTLNWINTKCVSWTGKGKTSHTLRLEGFGLGLTKSESATDLLCD